MDYETGAAILVALAAFKVIEGLVGKLIGKVDFTAMGERIKALHAWHAPTEDGVQSWKNPGISNLLQEIRDGIRDLLTEVKRQNGKST